MTDAVTIALGGRTWAVEQLPFGALKVLQPAYLAFTAKMAENPQEVAMSPELIGEMGELFRKIVAGSGIALEADEFEKLRFGLADLIDAFQKVGGALGIVRAAPGETPPASAPAKPKRSTGRN